MALWGFNFVVAKIVLAELPLFTMMTIRFILASCILIPFYKKPPAHIGYIALLAFVFAVLHMGGSFGGMAVGLDAGMATLIEQTNAPFLLILGTIFLKEKIGIKSITGIILSFIGTYILLQAPTSASNPIGFALVLAGAFFWGVYCLLLKKLKDVPALALVGWISLLAAPMTAIISLFTETRQLESIASASNTIWLLMIYMVIAVSIGAHGLWCYLLSRMSIGHLAPTTLMVPLFGVLGGVMFLGELFSLQIAIGGTLIIIGVAIILLRRPKTVVVDIDV